MTGTLARALPLTGTAAHDVSVDEVGAKAYNLMRLAQAGLPVPYGFVLGAGFRPRHPVDGRDDGTVGGAVDDAVPDPVRQVLRDGVQAVERETGCGFGAPRHPLLLSVRSGAAASMPGMLDTVLDVGLTDATVGGLLRSTGDPRFVWDSYRRLIESYGEVTAGCAPALAAATDDTLRRARVPDVAELDVAQLQELVRNLQAAYRMCAGRPFPQDPLEQLVGAVAAVWRSWDSARAVEYRRQNGLTGLRGTAITVQTMVFGNLGMTSGSGVGFTRDPATGADRLYVDFLLNAQGEDIVAGRRAADESQSHLAAIPGLAHELQVIRRRLELLFRDVQDFEFTVQEGRLWLLQTRDAQRTPLAALRIACELVDEGLIDPATAVRRLDGVALESVSTSVLADGHATAVGHGTPAGAGIAGGLAALSAATAQQLSAEGHHVVLVRDRPSTDDIAALPHCRGLLTATGARTSHATVVARQLGVTTVVGCEDLVIDEQAGHFDVGAAGFEEGDPITIDGTDGAVYPGQLPTVDSAPTELIERVEAWRDATSPSESPTG